MTHGPIDSEIKLGTCARCQAYVFAANSSGLKVAADPAPVNRDGYVKALAAGRRLFALLTVAGRPSKLLSTRSGTPPPPFAPNGSQEATQRPVLAEHSCGAHGMDAARVEVVPEGPPPAPVTPGGHRGGPRPPTAPAGAVSSSQTPPRPPPAAPAKNHLSDLDPGGREAHGGTPQPPAGPVATCDTCRRRLPERDIGWGIEHAGRWIWARHDECP